MSKLLLLLLAMRTIIRVVFLELANISLPTEVLGVDETNNLIGLIAWSVLMVSIESSLRATSHLDLIVELNVLLLSWLFCLFLLDFVLLRNDSNLHCITLSLDTDSFLHVVVNGLLAEETTDLVVSQTVGLVRGRWHSLHEANHCFVAFRVELVVVACLKVSELSKTSGQWVRRDVLFHSVLEIGQKPQSILQLNFKCLVVNSGPSAG